MHTVSKPSLIYYPHRAINQLILRSLIIRYVEGKKRDKRLFTAF